MGEILSWATDPTIAAAFIGLGGIALGSVGGWWSGRKLSHENLTSVNLEAQLEGWKNYSETLIENMRVANVRIEALERRIELCERDRLDLWQRIRRNTGNMNEEC